MDVGVCPLVGSLMSERFARSPQGIEGWGKQLHRGVELEKLREHSRHMGHERSASPVRLLHADLGGFSVPARRQPHMTQGESTPTQTLVLLSCVRSVNVHARVPLSVQTLHT